MGIFHASSPTLGANFAADAPRWIQQPSSEYPSTRESVQKQVMLNAL